MTTNKPEVVGLEVGAYGSSPLIRLSDYEALQAECEKLRKDAERYRHLRDRLTGPTFDNLFFLELYNVGAFDHPDDIDDAVDDAMQEGEHDN